MYFQCSASGHRCLGPFEDYVGCGSPWDENSRRLVDSSAFHFSLISSVPGNMCARMVDKSVSLSLRSNTSPLENQLG